jgi:ABC-2 type transport system ATP-binding protein
MGFLRPTSGSARILGRDTWAAASPAHRNVAFLSSEPGFLGDLTAERQLEYLAALRGLPANAWRPVAERLGLDASVPVRKLSRGNRQKIGVVSVFMGTEPVLLLDEPTSGLDPLLQREFLSMLAEARHAGRTVLLSSHNLPEVERASDRVAIIRDGRIVEIATVADLLGAHWRSVNLVLGDTPLDGALDLPNVRLIARSGADVHLMVRGDPNPLLRALATLDVHDVSITTPDIEDVFLRFYAPEPPAS